MAILHTFCGMPHAVEAQRWEKPCIVPTATLLTCNSISVCHRRYSLYHILLLLLLLLLLFSLAIIKIFSFRLHFKSNIFFALQLQHLWQEARCMIVVAVWILRLPASIVVGSADTCITALAMSMTVMAMTVAVVACNLSDLQLRFCLQICLSVAFALT